ncbi:hypothetical protein Q7P35_005941 [Cladosporium inversicolor]
MTSRALMIVLTVNAPADLIKHPPTESTSAGNYKFNNSLARDDSGVAHFVVRTSSTADRRSLTAADQRATQLVHESPLTLLSNNASDLKPSSQSRHQSTKEQAKVARLHGGGKQFAKNTIPSHHVENANEQSPNAVANSTARRRSCRHLTQTRLPESREGQRDTVTRDSDAATLVTCHCLAANRQKMDEEHARTQALLENSKDDREEEQYEEEEANRT